MRAAISSRRWRSEQRADRVQLLRLEGPHEDPGGRHRRQPHAGVERHPTSVQYGGGRVRHRAVVGRRALGLLAQRQRHQLREPARRPRTQLGTQLDFIWYELTTFSGYGLASLKAATTVWRRCTRSRRSPRFAAPAMRRSATRTRTRSSPTTAARAGRRHRALRAAATTATNALGMNMPDDPSSRASRTTRQCSNGMRSIAGRIRTRATASIRSEVAMMGHAVRRVDAGDATRSVARRLRGVGVVDEALDEESGGLVTIETLRDVPPDGLYRLKRDLSCSRASSTAAFASTTSCSSTMAAGSSRWSACRPRPAAPRGQRRAPAARRRSRSSPRRCASCTRPACPPRLQAVGRAGARPTATSCFSFGFVEDTGPGGHAGSAAARFRRDADSTWRPEQALAAEAPDPRPTRYQLRRAVLYEALTGQFPHDGDTPLALMLNKQRSDPPRRLDTCPRHPRRFLDALCAESSLRIEPGARPTGPAAPRRLGQPASRDSRPSFVSVLAAFARDVRGSHRRAEPAPRGVSHAEAARDDGARRGSVGRRQARRWCAGSPRRSPRAARWCSAVAASSASPCRTRRSTTRSSALPPATCASSPDVEVAALLPRHPDLLVRMFPVLGAIRAMSASPAARPALGDPQEQRSRAFAALREVLHRLASRRRLRARASRTGSGRTPTASALGARFRSGTATARRCCRVLTARPEADAETATRIEAIATPGWRRIRGRIARRGAGARRSRQAAPAVLCARARAPSSRDRRARPRDHPL